MHFFFTVDLFVIVPEGGNITRRSCDLLVPRPVCPVLHQIGEIGQISLVVWLHVDTRCSWLDPAWLALAVTNYFNSRRYSFYHDEGVCVVLLPSVLLDWRYAGHFIPFALVFVGNCAIVFKIFASKRLRDVAAKDDKGSRKVEHFSYINYYYIGPDILLSHFIAFGSVDTEC